MFDQVYSFVEDMAASGGYWLACAGQKIFVSSRFKFCFKLTINYYNKVLWLILN